MGIYDVVIFADASHGFIPRKGGMGEHVVSRERGNHKERQWQRDSGSTLTRLGEIS